MYRPDLESEKGSNSGEDTDSVDSVGGGSVGEQRRARAASARRAASGNEARGSGSSGVGGDGRARASGSSSSSSSSSTGRGSGSVSRGSGSTGRGGSSRASSSSGGSSSSSASSATSGSGATGALEGINTLLDSIGDTSSERGSDTRQLRRNLAGDGVGELLGSVVLVVKAGLDGSTPASSNKLRLLVNEVTDRGLDLLGQVLHGGGKTKGISLRKSGLARQGGDTLVGSGDDVGRVADQVVAGTAGVGLDVGVKRTDNILNARKDGLEGGDITLDNGSLALDQSRGGHGLGSEAQGNDGRGELHACGVVLE